MTNIGHTWQDMIVVLDLYGHNSVIVSEDTKSYAHKHILWQVTKSLYKSISQK